LTVTGAYAAKWEMKKRGEGEGGDMMAELPGRGKVREVFESLAGEGGIYAKRH